MSVKFPEICNCLGKRNMTSAIRQQLTTKDKEIIRQNVFEFLPPENSVVRYDCLPIRGAQYLTSGLGIEKGKRPDLVWICVSPHARTVFLA